MLGRQGGAACQCVEVQVSVAWVLVLVVPLGCVAPLWPRLRVQGVLNSVNVVQHTEHRCRRQ